MQENQIASRTLAETLFKKIGNTDIWEFDVPAACEEIRCRAYLKWETAGKPHGRDVEFWLEAEEEVVAIAKQLDQIWFTDP